MPIFGQEFGMFVGDAPKHVLIPLLKALDPTEKRRNLLSSTCLFYRALLLAGSCR